MRLSGCIAATIVCVGSLFRAAAAHSTKRNPLNYLTTIDEPIIHTPSHRVHSQSSFDLSFLLHQKQQRIKLTLSPNNDVIAEGATVQYLAPDGSVRSTEFIDRSEHRIFKGDAWIQHSEGAEWTNVGWARITVHRDGQSPIFEGAFRLEGDHNHIQTRRNYMQTKHQYDPWLEEGGDDDMILWRDSDVIPDHPTELRRSLGDLSCSADELSFNTQPETIYAPMPKKSSKLWDIFSTRSIYERQIDNSTGGNSGIVNLFSTIGSTAGCPTTRKVALVGVATDCTYTAAFNSTASVRSNIITQINLASTQYENSFNISLGIQNLTISDASCPATAPSTAPWNVPCSNSVTIQNRLNLFSGWRGQQTDTNAYWTLLSTCNTGSAVGLAWLGQLCINSASTSTSGSVNETVSSANVVVRTTGSEWQVIAHETGHTFGAVHDCTTSTCNDGVTVNAQQCCPLSASTCDAGGVYIMNPSTGVGITKFSPCSIGNICTALGRNSVKSTCLTSNKNIATITGSQCGNGIVEVGEDCDCGGTSGCGNNPCCDPTTCKFKANAVCDPSNEDCCQSSCQFSTNGTVCRASTGTCDYPEVCSGTAATCPVDLSAPDGTVCDASQSLTCSSGHCTSRDLQCKTLMGAYTKSNSTYACSPSGCQISCASPEFGANVCYKMQQNFLDGTDCGGGGRCSNGVCQGSSVGGEITSWISSNKPLVIGLAAGVGGFLLLAILCCIVSCCRRRRRRKRIPQPPPWPMQQAGPTRVQPQWEDRSFYPRPQRQSRGGAVYPGWQAPPPAYAGYGEPSVRYA